MSFQDSSERPMAATIRCVFKEEIMTAGGTVSDEIEARGWLFLRGVLPAARDIEPKDRLQAGVALRASEHEAWVHPYVFRQVCSNGAVFAQAVQSCHLTDLELRTPDEAEAALREAISACCTHEAFDGAFAGMRSALDSSIDERQAREIASMLISITHMSASRNSQTDCQLFELILRLTDGFGKQGRPTRYSLLNNVTATARDAREPDVRWRLEELGGAIASSRLGGRPRQFDGCSVQETVAV